MSKNAKTKNKVANILGLGPKHDKLAEYLDIFIEILVLLNVAAVILESFESIYLSYKLEFDLFEIFTVCVFTTEFVLRLWVSDIKYPHKYRWQAYKKFLLSPNAFIDILAILPFFIPFLIDIDLRHLRIFRLMRLLRVFKLTKYSQSLKQIGKIMSEKKQELMATLLLTFSVLVISSSLMYYVEREVQPEAFKNILYSFWWGIATLTTVGYGDIYPMTGLGKILGAVVALMGVLIVAIPTGIISSSFVQKMEENNYKKRMNSIRSKLKEAFYKKYVPEIACKVRRGQLSVDAVKVNLELAEEDIYKIAEGRNEFRFRYKKVLSNGILTDKLFLEYREIDNEYGTFTNRKHHITLISPESLNNQSIGYLVYCISEKLKCNYISNEFFGDEASVLEESFGDKGLEPETAFNFRHNKAYLQKTEDPVPHAFLEWMEDLKKIKSNKSIYIIFNTFEQEIESGAFIHLTYFKRNKGGIDEYSFADQEKIEAFRTSLIQKGESKFNRRLKVTANGNQLGVRENNIVLYTHEVIEVETLLIQIHQDYILNEKLFSLAAIVADAIKEDLIGLP